MSHKLSSLIEELDRRSKRKALVNNLHPGQRRIVDAMENCRFIGIRSARRWGKTEGLLRIGLDLADRLNGRCVYLAMYRTNAKSIAWPIANELNQYLGWSANQVELSLNGPGQRQLIIMGADRPDLARLLRGWKNCVVIIDEAQSWGIDLEDFCNSILRHTLTDMRGYLLVAGTPGFDDTGFFCRITSDNQPGWTSIVGETLENPYTSIQQKEEMDEILKYNSNANKEPWWLREYEGKWVSDNRNLVYPFSANNIIYNWTDLNKKKILAIDWGSTAESAFVVGEFDINIDNKLTYIDAFQQANMSLNDYVRVINDFRTRHNPILTVADPGGTNKALTNEIITRCNIPIINAEKVDKEAAIAAMIREMSLNMIQVVSPQCEPLLDCWKKLQWVKNNKGEREEKGANHLADAALYVRRAAWNYIFKPKAPPETEEQKMLRQIREQHEAEVRFMNKYYGGMK